METAEQPVDNMLEPDEAESFYNVNEIDIEGEKIDIFTLPMARDEHGNVIINPLIDRKQFDEYGNSLLPLVTEPEIGARTFRTTEMGNGERLAFYGINSIRRCTSKGHEGWLAWDGQRWKPSDEARIAQEAKKVVRNIYEEALQTEDTELRKELGKHAIKSESEHHIRAMIELAGSEPLVMIEQKSLDKDPWLLNCANGTLDLRTRMLMPHAREDHITKVIDVPCDLDAKCDRWRQFLDEIMGGRKDLVEFLQKAIGYSLTGSTREQCFFLLHGTGANGKSTFLDVLLTLFGEYGQQAAFQTFLSTNNNRGGVARGDIVRMAGIRFVSAVESGPFSNLDEVVVKHITGGDTVTARALYKSEVEFKPEFKIWLAANHLPGIRGTDNAIWRRVRCIPFDVAFPPDKQDKNLAAKLKQELPGILQWAINGCLDWQEAGELRLPDAVKEATESYRSEMDVLRDFLDERCVFGREHKIGKSELYRAYTKWCVGNSDDPVSAKTFTLRLHERGMTEKKIKGKRFWNGVNVQDMPKSD